jgi:glycosyltransferase involved in cell wall biosynthesis
MIRTANLIGSVSRNAGGLFYSVRGLVRGLGQQGVGVRVIGPRDEFAEDDLPSWRPIEMVTYRPLWPRQFAYSPVVSRALREYDPELTHTHGIWQYLSVATNDYYSRMRQPYIISPHGMLDPWALRNSRWKKVLAYTFYEGAHIRHAACLRALCESEAQSIRKLGLANPICVIPNGIEPPAARSPAAPPPWSKSIEPERKVLLFLSRIHPKKGLVNLLKAWAQLRKSGIRGQMAEWALAIAGWEQGGHEDALKRLATELEIPWADVRSKAAPGNSPAAPCSLLFLGPQFGEAKDTCFANCEAFILPSFSEGLPMAVLEAWTFGKPVVMTPECNIPEGFAASAAFRIEPACENLAQGLREFVAAPDAVRRQMGQRGLALVNERFAWSRIAGNMKAVYEWMLGGGPPPGTVRLD